MTIRLGSVECLSLPPVMQHIQNCSTVESWSSDGTVMVEHLRPLQVNVGTAADVPPYNDV